MTANEKRSLALKGRKKTPEHVEKVRLALIGRKLTPEHCAALALAHQNQTFTPEHRAKLSAGQKLAYAEGRRTGPTQAFCAAASERMRSLNLGRFAEKHPRWVADRTALAPRTRDRTAASLTWARAVKNRDGGCVLRMLGGCAGRLEAHHILSFRQYPELRYAVDNGISLCQAHHPRKRIEAEKLAPIFERIVANKKG
jgi:hypothetical protein